MTLRLNRLRLFAFLGGYTVAVNIAVVLKDWLGPLSAIIVFPFVVVVPGTLLLLLLRTRGVKGWRFAYYAVCASIVMLMLLGLAINWLLPLIGIDEPLRTLPVTLGLNVLVWPLMFAALHTTARFTAKLTAQPNKSLAHYLLPLGFILLAVVGAFRLNNGYGNWPILVLLVLILVDLVYLFRRANRVSEAHIIIHIFCAGLAMLLMTSLRGWFITGHDIQNEYFVFQLAKQQWHWQIGLYRDPYNACLSLTILPTMLSSLMKIGDIYIFKVLYQIIFAICPIGVYLLVSKISNRKLAILSVVYFLAFPTFFNDMPMLNRQEVAFVLITGMLLLLVEQRLRYRNRLLLFALFGVGVIVAHYSTTYSMLLTFGAACFVRFMFERRWFKRLADRIYTLFKRTTPPFIGHHQDQRLLIFPVIVFFALSAFLWNAQITHTSKGLFDTLKSAFSSISGNVREDAKSSDTQASLFGGSAPDPQELVDKYVGEQADERAQVDEAANYYARSSYNQYPIKASTDTTQPLTAVGRWLKHTGADVFALNYWLRQGFAKFLQILVLFGLLVLFFSKKPKLRPGAEYMAVSITSVLFLGILVLIPVLSVDYGLLRAFQQVLIVLALPTVLGSLVMFSFLGDRRTIVAAVAIASLFFLASTGVIAEITGGYGAQLHLHNSGAYYDNYYAHDGEATAIAWLGGQKAQATVQVDHLSAVRIRLLSRYPVTDGIFPALIQKGSFVYVGYTNVHDGKVYATYQNEGITYNYPLQFLDANKNLIFSSSQARIYR